MPQEFEDGIHCQPCHREEARAECPCVFDRVHASYLIVGGT